MTERVLKTAKVAKLKIPGKIRSKTETSLENRVKMRPIGFESKKIILDLMIFSTIFLCIFVVLEVKIMRITKFLAKVRMT